MAKFPVADLNLFARNYLISRAVYVLAYLTFKNNSLAQIRTLIWVYGVTISIRFILRAATAL